MGLRIQREALAQLEPEWRELLPRCRFGRPFISPAWLKLWWDQFGEGRELILLSIRDDDSLTGILPLMRRDGRISFAGDTEVCDYMDIAAPAGAEAAILDAALRALSEEPWREIVLWALSGASPTYLALPGVCRQLGLALETEVEGVCPQIELPASWEEYLEALNKKDRHELRRKLRRLSRAGETELEVLVSPAEVAGALDDFVRMHAASRAEKAAFMTGQMERFFRRMVVALAEEGLVEMIFLRLGGIRVAAVLCFRPGNEVLLYNSGYDPAYAGLSVGLLSKALALKRAIDQGLKKFDFLRGAERYKYHLGARDVAVHRCVIRRT